MTAKAHSVRISGCIVGHRAITRKKRKSTAVVTLPKGREGIFLNACHWAVAAA